MAARPVLYYAPRSPPSRSVLLAARALNLDLELKLTINDKGENRTPEFLKVGFSFIYIILFPNWCLVQNQLICNEFVGLLSNR